MENLKNNPKHVLYWTAAAALTIGALSTLWYVSAYARSLRPEGGWNTVTVSAEGTASPVPDVGQLGFSVISEGGTDISALQEDNTKKMNDILAFLDEQDVEKEDVKTASYQVTPRYQYFPCTAGSCRPAQVVGYTVSQTVQVKVRDLARSGDIIAGATERGANGITGPDFVVDDATGAENEARAMAIGKAKEKARMIAQQSGLRLGKLLSVSDDYSGGVQPYGGTQYESGAIDGKGTASPVLEPGSQEVKVSVSLTYSVR